MKPLIGSFTFLLLLFSFNTVHAVPTNVALGANVTLNGTFFTGGWGAGLPPDQQARADTLVDGIFLDTGHQWDQDTVWWDINAGGRTNTIEINLGGWYSIDSFIVQVDDNDAYVLDYWNGSAWELAWDIPNYDNVPPGWGMLTRPNVNDNTERYMLGSAITTDMLRLRGNPNSSDGLYAVSEVQAFGVAVPEPTTLLLFGSSLVLIGLARNRKTV